MSNYVYIQASIAVRLPDNIPEAPDYPNNFTAYDEWYDKYIEPTMKKFYSIPELEDIDIHDQEIEIDTGD